MYECPAHDNTQFTSPPIRQEPGYLSEKGKMLSSSVLRIIGAFAFVGLASSTPLVYDGRATFNITKADLNASIGPYLT